MSRLLKAFDSYMDLNHNAYFVLHFDAIPSDLSVYVPLKEGKRELEAAIDLLDASKLELESVNRSWSTADTKDIVPNADFPCRMLFKSRTRPLLLWLSLQSDHLHVHFYYDMHDPGLEDWVISRMHLLRTAYGERRTHSFKVLTHDGCRFTTQDVSTGGFSEVELSRLYNDDFVKVDQQICRSISGQASGLILLHGQPGTGKTSYIKHLIARYDAKSFIFIQNEFVKDLLKPGFISFLLERKDAILIIEDAEKVIMSREAHREDSVVSTILQLTDGLFSDYLNLKIICTFNTDIRKVDKALLRKGRLIAMYEFGALSPTKTSLLGAEMGLSLQGQSLVLADIFKYADQPQAVQRQTPKIGFRQS